MHFGFNKTHKRQNYLIFTLVIWVFYALFFSYNTSETAYVLWFSTFLTIITVLSATVISFILIPKYLNKKLFLKFGIFLTSVIFFTAFCIIVFMMVVVAYVPEITMADLPPMGKHYAHVLILVYLVITVVGLIGFWRQHNKATVEKNTLEKHLLETRIKLKEQELAHLKGQLHPHFLFNTLNTIYGHALKASEKTPEMVLQLSDLLDYMLYKADKPYVPLRNEVKYIKQYIALEKSRFSDSHEVSFDVQTDEDDLTIAPLILLPFFENAFKHASANAGHIKILAKLEVRDSQFAFHIKNTHRNSQTTNGIGLSNIKERLQIIYPEKHDLVIREETNWFNVTLNLKLE